MKKKLLSLLIVLMFTVQGLVVPQASAAVFPVVSAPSAMLLDSNNTVIFSKTPHLRRAPASTTKLLTAIVALNLMDANTIVTVPQYATTMPPSKIHIRTGERYVLRDLIYATLVNSGNDAAAAVAITTGGSFAGFAREMNKKATALGAQDSNFVNPSGLPDARQYSTVYDMTLIMQEAQRYPLIVQALKFKSGYIYSVSGRRIYLKNHNKMLWRDTREVLGKTGWTQAARHCFVGQISVGGKKVFVAMLGSHRLWRDLKTLVDFQFGKSIVKAYKNKKLVARENNKKIQLALKRAGVYSGPIDGHMGAATKKAIKLYQKKHGLPQTGSAGPKTWNLLKKNL